MNPKAINSARTAPRIVSQKDKDFARQCLILADKFLKEDDFVKARAEVGKAQKLDPSNPYAYAFLDRITYFEDQIKKKEAHKKDTEEAERKAEEEAKRKKEEEERKIAEAEARKKEEEAKTQREEEAKRKAEEEARRKADEEKKRAEEAARRKAEEESKKAGEAARKKAEEDRKKAEEEARKKTEEEARKKDEEERQRAEAAKLASQEQPKKPEQPAKPSAPVARKPGSLIDAARPLIAEMMAARPKQDAQQFPQTPAIAEVLEQVSQASHHSSTAPKGDIDVKLDEMRRQIEMLTKALDQERKVREEMNQQQMKGAIHRLRSALEKAWINGVPKDSEVSSLHDLATSLGIPEEIEKTINREVKLDMYSRAVKEVVAKQKLLRNSSRTLEWLRNVYKVTIDEYLEYESKFLLDLVADQYKGTILLVTGDEKIAAELGQRLKSIGYAVVNALSPENALEKIEKINPHYVLCDMEFAGGALSGIKFLHVLRASSKFSYVPFIMLCQTSEITQLKSSELRSTEGYVEKPIEMEKLNQVMGEKLSAFRQYLSSL